MAMVPDADRIGWLVATFHVSMGDDEVRANIESRMPADVLDTVKEQAVEYALDEHHANQEMYRKVMSGRF